MRRPRSHSRAALGALLICAATLPLLSGCTWVNRVLHRGGKTSTGCTLRPFAGNADSRAPLKVADGLSAPDTRGAVKIPDLGTAGRDRPKTEPCLAQPPNFFAKSLVTPETPKGKRAAPPVSAPAAPKAAAPSEPAAPNASSTPPAPSAPPAAPASAPTAPPAPAEEAPVPPG